MRVGSRDLGRGRLNERLRFVFSFEDGFIFFLFDVEYCIYRFYLFWESGLSFGLVIVFKNLEFVLRNIWWFRF